MCKCQKESLNRPIFNAYEAMMVLSQKEKCQCKDCKCQKEKKGAYIVVDKKGNCIG